MCEDCGLAYSEHGIDSNLTDAMWDAVVGVNPYGNPLAEAYNMILCVACVAKRLARLGIKSIDIIPMDQNSGAAIHESVGEYYAMVEANMPRDYLPRE